MTPTSLSPDWPCAQGYVWFTRRRGSTIDTRVLGTGPPYKANMGTPVNSESIENRDLVVCYRAHLTNDSTADPPNTSTSAGPTSSSLLLAADPLDDRSDTSHRQQSRFGEPGVSFDRRFRDAHNVTGMSVPRSRDRSRSGRELRSAV